MIKQLPRYIMIVLLALGFLSAIVSFFNDSHEFLLQLMNILTIVSGIMFVVALIHGMVLNKSAFKTFALEVIGLLVVSAIGYGMADEIVNPNLADMVTPEVAKLSGMSIHVAVILTVLAVLSIAASSVMNLVRK